ncbi:hypothetical protein ISS07_02390 [Candidatus Woesearchaeota archaeon]|nr:hypothetical protein [Candidatus Woesearchaeota archaeon]
MKQVLTKDNSLTFHNEEYDETYHSTSGALEESFEKFVKPSKLKDGMKVLDVCFGLGYNSLATISSANVSITALENDKTILEKIKQITIPQDSKYNHLERNYEKIKKAAEKREYSDEKIKIKIIVDDARKSIKNIKEKFDVCFLDPFSTKKCPELWTEEFFKNIRKVMKKDAVLTTYSCATQVRKNLEKANFKVEDGPCIGRRSPSTIAYAI